MKLMGKLARRAFKGCGALVLLGLLSSCGGGIEQITAFAPTRLLIFGDEMSVLTKTDPKGRKYSVNALGADNATLDCVARPLWFQIVAYTYGFAFEECNPSNQAETAAKIFAEPGAKSDDLPAQIARARLLTGCFNETDLVTLLVGANDVLDAYKNLYVPDAAYQGANYTNNPTYKAAIAELNAKGALLGQRINALTTLGPKVIVSTIPLMNLTPYALREAIDRPLANVLNVLLDFSNTFNTAMRVNILNDGRFIGLVELDALLNAGVGDPSRYGLANVTNAVCDPLTWNTTDCDTNTLVTNGNATTWLWASDLWIGSTGHLNLGNFARGRALGNPFGSPSGTQCQPPPPGGT
jgi:outer membrane lipase/esterase